MRRGIPWLIAAFVFISAVVSVRAAYDDGRTTLVIKKINGAQDSVVLALDRSPERVVLALLAVQKRPDAPTTLPAADERALFGLDLPPAAPKADTVEVALVTPELPVVEERPLKRVRTVSRTRSERCGKLCKGKRYAVRTRDRAEPRKRIEKRFAPAKAAPEVVATAAPTSKEVDLRVPAQAHGGATALTESESATITSGGIRLNGRTSLNLRPLSTVMPSRTPDHGEGRAAFSDDRDDPSRSGVAAGVTFKLN